MKNGVLLVNMGGPQSEKEMFWFLRKMFRDPCILPFSRLGREWLSLIISSFRYKKSWKKYELIGGSPIIKSSNAIKNALSEKLGKNFIVDTAYSYSKPLIKNKIAELRDKGVEKIKVIPMYPHASISTIGSIHLEISKLQKKSLTNIDIQNEYYTNSQFIRFWSDLIFKHIDEYQLNYPTLLFSAHSIPEYHINKGDTYPISITESAKLIAQETRLEYYVAYQSQMKKGEWIGPKTESVLEGLSNKNKEVVIIPISFVNENLETIYDIDKIMIPECKKRMKFKSLTRIKIPKCSPIFTELLINLVNSK